MKKIGVHLGKGIFDVPTEVYWLPEEVAAAEAIIASLWPSLEALLPEGHIWGKPKRVHALKTRGFIDEIYPGIGLATDHPMTLMAKLAAEAIDLGRVMEHRVNNGQPVPLGFIKGNRHGVYSAEILRQWQVRLCFHDIESADILQWVVEHHSDVTMPPTPKSRAYYRRMRHFLLATVRDLEVMATCDLKTDLYLWDEGEKAKQSRAMRDNYRPDFLGEAGVINEEAMEAFRQWKPVPRELCATYEAYMLQYLSWIFDFSLEAALASTVVRRMAKSVLRYFEQRLSDSSQHAQVFERVIVWFQSHGVKYPFEGV